MDKYAVKPNKIEVIYNNSGPEFRIIEYRAELEKTRVKYNLERTFVSYPEANLSHKNQQNLITKWSSW